MLIDIRYKGFQKWVRGLKRRFYVAIKNACFSQRTHNDQLKGRRRKEAGSHENAIELFTTYLWMGKIFVASTNWLQQCHPLLPQACMNTRVASMDEKPSEVSHSSTVLQRGKGELKIGPIAAALKMSCLSSLSYPVGDWHFLTYKLYLIHFVYQCFN